VANYNTNDFKRGLKVQIDGDPYLMVECNFVKPGKGNALYECKLKNLIRGTTVDRTYRAGQVLEEADVVEFAAQYLYKQQDTFVFMDNANYEQYELSKEQTDDAWKYLKEGMECSMVLFNNRPITVTPPNHVVLKITYCEPAVRGNTATNLTKPVQVETGAEFICPAFVEMGESIRIDNDDIRDYMIGPFFVMAGQTLAMRFTQPGTIEGVCQINPEGKFTITVVEADA